MSGFHPLKTLRVRNYRPAASMGERPEPQLLLADGPEPRQAVGLNDQKEDDQRAEDHRLQIGHQINRNLEPGKARRVVEKNRQQHNESGAEEGAEDAAEAADDDHEQDLERAVYLKGAGLDRARIDEGPHCPGDAAVERAQGERQQFRLQRADADDLRSDIHIADRHPGAPDATAHQTLGGEREENDHGQDEQVFRARIGLGARDVKLAENGARRRADHTRGAVIVEPREFIEHPDQEELRRKRGYREVEALDPETRKAEQHADQRSHDAGQNEGEDDVESREGGGELVGRKGADRHEAAGAERHLPGIAGQQVEAERRQRVDEERDHDRQQPIFGADRGDHEIGEGERREQQPSVLADRKDRLVGGVARLELADLTINHRSNPLDDAFAEEALRAEQQEDEREGISETVLDRAAEGGPPKDLGDLLAGPDDQTADNRARHRGQAAEDQHRQRLERHQRDRELHTQIAAPHDAGNQPNNAGDRPHDDPDG